MEGLRVDAPAPVRRNREESIEIFLRWGLSDKLEIADRFRQGLLPLIFQSLATSETRTRNRIAPLCLIIQSRQNVTNSSG